MRVAGLVACVALAACATPEQRAQYQAAQMSDARSLCLAAGFQPSTPELAQCTMMALQRAQAADAERRQQAIEAGIKMMTARPEPPANTMPFPIICRSLGNGVVSCQ